MNENGLAKNESKWPGQKRRKKSNRQNKMKKTVQAWDVLKTKMKQNISLENK